jgi:hypothetical protein
MTVHYSVLISVEDDSVSPDITSAISNAIVGGAKTVDGVTDATVSQIMQGDELYPITEP